MMYDEKNGIPNFKKISGICAWKLPPIFFDIDMVAKVQMYRVQSCDLFEIT